MRVFGVPSLTSLLERHRGLTHKPPQLKLVKARLPSELGLGGLGQTPQSEELPDPRPVDAQELFQTLLGIRYAALQQVLKPLGNLNWIEA